MCGLCGSLSATDWTDGVASGEPSAIASARRRTRRERAAAVSRALRPYGLSLADWQGATFLLRSRTGAVAHVAGLFDLWPAAERMAGRPIDPLDPALIAALGR